MIVVDTNVLAYFFINGKQSKYAHALLENDRDWVAPVLWRSEFRNIISAYMRNGLLDLSGGKRLMRSALELMRGGEFDVPSNQVLALSSASGLTAYDCEFVALAHELGCDLFTSDKKIVTAFPETAKLLKAVADGEGQEK